jgi:hypothetical protein
MSDRPAADPILAMVEAGAAGGETVALATVLTGQRLGARLVVWSAGHTFGDLGWPRLNQRVALYAEQLFERGARGVSTKRFDVPGEGSVEVRLEFHSAAGAPGRPL